MLNSEKILAIITARGGSKGILHKNIKLLNGKPLISYTIESALKSKLIDEVIVSTDDDKISEISKQYGATVPFKRPKIFAKDSSSSESVIIHTLNWLETKNQKFFDLFILLQPTSPLRTYKHIDNALKCFNRNKLANTLYSVVEVKQIPYKMIPLSCIIQMGQFIFLR